MRPSPRSRDSASSGDGGTLGRTRTRRRSPGLRTVASWGQIELPMKDTNRRGGKRKDRDRLTVLSLFTSFGLGDLGIREAGGDCLVMAEYHARRCSFLRRNYPGAAVIEGDIRCTKDGIVEEPRRRLAGDELFLLVATPPCQGMSSNGKGRINRAVREGKRPARDPRNALVLPAL